MERKIKGKAEYRIQLLGISRHARTPRNKAWEETKGNPNALGIFVPGLDKNTPAYDYALADFDRLGLMIARGCCNHLTTGPIRVMSSTCRRAEDSRDRLWRSLLRHGPNFSVRERESHSGLNPRNYGFFDWMTEHGIKTRFPQEHAKLIADGWWSRLTYAPPGGESWWPVIDRIAQFKEDVIDASPENMFLVAHRQVLPILCPLILGSDLDLEAIALDRGLRVGNAELILFWRHHDGVKALSPWRFSRRINGRHAGNYHSRETALDHYRPDAPAAVVRFKDWRRQAALGRG